MSAIEQAARCTNCGISGAQLFNWWRSLERSMGATAGIMAPPNYVCCDPPYVVGQTAVPFEELVFRSLPRGEDR